MVAPNIVGFGKEVLGQVVKQSIEKAVEKVSDNPKIDGINHANEDKVAGAVIQALEKDTTFINATNSEPWYQSGVAWGSGLAALSVLIPIVAGWFGVGVTAEQVTEVGGSIGTLAGILFILYRRFMPGLKPLFSGKRNV